MTRIQRLLEVMKNEGVDGFLTCDPTNRRYLTRFPSSAGWVAVSADQSVFFCDSRYTEAAKAQITDCRVEQVSGFGDALEKWAEGLERIGVESERLTLSEYEMLCEKIGKERLVSLKDPVARLRAVKDEEELSALTEAAAIADDAWTAFLGAVRVGRSEKELAWKLEQLLRERGAEKLSFDTIMASGVNGACPHAVPSDRLLQKGDLLTVDFGCVKNGYCSDMTRTVAVGEVSEEQRFWYESVLKAQEGALAAVHAGASCREIDRLSRELLKPSGLDGYFGHALGHGVGLEIHEQPTLSPRSDTLLEAGMVVTIEPGVYLPEKGGLRIEDTVVVTPDGCRRLTQSSKVLTIL